MPVWQLYLVHFQDYDLDTCHQICRTPKDLLVRWARDAGSIKPAAIHNGEGTNHYFHQTSNSRAAAMCSSSRATWGSSAPAVYLGRQLQSRMLDGDALVRRRSCVHTGEDPFHITLDPNAHGKEIKTNQYYYGEEVGYWAHGTPP